MAKPDKTRLPGMSLPTPLVNRLKTEAENRVVGESLLVQRGLELLFETLPPVTAIDEDAPIPAPALPPKGDGK